MKVAIVGYGIEGRSALTYYQGLGADITVCDQDTEKDLPEGIHGQLGAHYLKDLDRFDVIVRTVGMHPKIILEENPGVQDKITTTVDEFMRVCPTKNVIGVTGTKGKGTTSTLIVKMLEAMGKKVFLGGNFGIPAFSFLSELTPDDWVVMELSSFMLYDIRHSPHIGVCLMVQPEHLDWHGGMEDYVRSKSNMFAHQASTDVAIYYADNAVSHQIASASPGKKIAYYDEPGAYIFEDKIMIDQTVICHTNEVKLLGKHNWQNICAAATAAWQVMQAPDAIRTVVTTMTGLPHRLELVRELDGVRYYNDSFSSDPYAAEAGIEAIPGKKVLILGGYDRMIPLDTLTKTVKKAAGDIRMAILIGASGQRIATNFSKADFTNFRLSPAKNMTEIVSEARQHAKKGDAVLLSPGFASFDMFKNFEVRGEQFKEVVHSL